MVRNTMKSPKKEDTEELLSLLITRVTLGKDFAKTYQDDVAKWQKDYTITTIKDAKFTNLDNQIQIPYIFSTVESGSANIFEKFPSILMLQRGKEDAEFTEFAQAIWQYLNTRLSLEEKIEEAGLTFLNDGQVTGRYGWNLQLTTVEEPQIDQTTGQPVLDEKGNPVMQKIMVPVKNLPYFVLHDYKTIYFSPESKFVLDDEENKIPFAYWIQTLTKDQVSSDYQIEAGDDELEAIELDSDKQIKNLPITEVDKNQITSDLMRVKVYNYVGMLPKDTLPADLQEQYDPENVYYTAFTKKRIYRQPERIAKKPLLNLGHYGLMNKFYRFGEAKVLRELEQDVSLGRSRIMDLRDRQGTKVGVPQGTEFDEESFKKARDYTFMRFIGNNPPLYINPPPLPDTIITAIQQSRDDIQMASATMDISRASMQNTIDTATGQKIFSGETMKRNAKKKKKIARFIRAIAKNLLILCGQNMTEEEMNKITDIPVEMIKEQGWKEKMALLGDEYDIEIDVDTLGDTKESDAANAIALFREMKDSPYINQEELIKYTLKVGFKKKDADKFLATYVSPDTILKVLQKLMEDQIIMPEDAQMIAAKLDQSMAQQQEQGNQGNAGGFVGKDEGRPATGNPIDIVKKSMPGTDTNQMQAQRQAAYKQTGVAKGPQNIR